MTLLFVCQSCHQPQKWHGHKVAKRIEYRTLDGKDRIGAKTIGYLCKSCALAELAVQEPSYQGALL